MTVAVTTIAEALDDSETGVDVTNALGFPATAPYTVRVDAEWMRVTAGAGTTTWTVTRGYNSTTAASHNDASSIFHVHDTYADLSRIKRRLRGGADSETDDDDDLLTQYIADVQSFMYTRVGMFFGPTTTTQIDLDGRDALIDRTKLYVPFGIQSLTSVEVQPYTGADFATVTATDLVSSPREWEPKIDPNQPTTMLMFKDVVSGTYSSFPSGVGNVRITGTLGWSEPPAKLGEIADTVVIRMYHAAQTGQRDYIGTDEDGNAIISRFLSAADYRTLDRFHSEVMDAF
jgi:hypothetical protein